MAKKDLVSRIVRMTIWVLDDEANTSELSTREKIAVAMALDRRDLLPNGCTMLEAFDRIGGEWTRAALAAQRSGPKPRKKYLVKGRDGRDLVIREFDTVHFVDVMPGTLASVAAGVNAVIMPKREGIVMGDTPVSEDGYVDTVPVFCDIEGKHWTIGVAASNILSVERDRPT